MEKNVKVNENNKGKISCVQKKGGTCRMAPVASTFSLICREMVYAKHTQNVG